MLASGRHPMEAIKHHSLFLCEHLCCEPISGDYHKLSDAFSQVAAPILTLRHPKDYLTLQAHINSRHMEVVKSQISRVPKR
jgi:hypothetical protein